MYKVSYYTTENKDVIFIKWFKSLKDSTEFVLKLKLPELLIEIKYYDEEFNGIMPLEILIDTKKKKGVMKLSTLKKIEDLEYAEAQFKNGNSDYAQRYVLNSTTYCTSCHTSVQKGREISWGREDLANSMSPLDRAQYYVALRNFDKALEEYNRILSNPDPSSISTRDWLASAKKSLAIAVRIKGDSALGLKIIEQLQASSSVPHSLQQTILQWKLDLVAWQKENKKKSNPTKFTSQLKEANRLLQSGWKVSQFTTPENGSVYFLRASRVLNHLLDGELDKKQRAQVLYTSGLVAESLKDNNLWTVHEMYYESCIRLVPRTEQAKKCYLRYETLVFSEYLSSPYNGYIPVHIKNQLDQLKKIAEMGEWSELLNWGLVE
jgi:tetratricopeptide (TPR) repeat protein